MKPSPELTAAVAAAGAAMVVDVVAVAVVVVTAAVVAVIATTIVTNANHGGNIPPRITQTNTDSVLVREIRGYFLASGLSLRLNLSVPRKTSIAYSSPAFISPRAAV